MDMNKVVETYIKIRDARSELKKRFDAQDKEMKAKLGQLEGFMLSFMQDNGMDSVKTGAGTFYRQEEVRPSGSDWDALYRWIGENNAYEALERRVKKGFVTEYMEEHGGGLPPGVSVHREFVVRVRRG